MEFLKVIYFNKLINRLNKNLKIQQKTYLAFLFVSIIILIISIYSIAATFFIQKNQKDIDVLNSISKSFSELITIKNTAETYIVENDISKFLFLEKKFGEISDSLPLYLERFGSEMNEMDELLQMDFLFFSTDIKRAANEYFQFAKSQNTNSLLTNSQAFESVKKALDEFGKNVINKKAAVEQLLAEKITEQSTSVQKIRITIGFMLLVGLFMCVIIANYVSYRITAPIKKLTDNIATLAKGNFKLDHEFEVLDNDEIGEICIGIESIGNTLEETVRFTEEVGNNNFEAELNIEKSGSLAKALSQMRDKLFNVTKINEQKRIEEEQRNWIIQGLAKFNDILRINQDNIETLHYEIIKNLINYIDANQGGLFVIEEDDNHKILELKAMFAYNRQKFMEKQIELGVGLIGQVALEMKTRYLTEIPNNYIEIGSGLGGSNPKNLIIIPLQIEGEIFGIIEIASFKEILEHQREFLERAAENIASAISALQITMRTKELLEKSQQQAEEMAAQEEEMRQNMEELQATQEESDRRNQQVQELLDSSKKKEDETLAMLEAAYERQAEFQELLAIANQKIEELKKSKK